MNRYVMCLDNKSHTVSLEVRKVYKVIDDPAIEARGAIRIIDETGEDYMYEAGRFVPVELPETAEEVFETAHA
ncbi:MAG: hypothetical protein IT328_04915 [Caldilineaceae bacterium]|nr:hypothetical protein [Caldilineaceae bacterium]